MDRTAKKHLMAIPVQPYTGDGSAFARVYTEKDILMLHLWNNGEFGGQGRKIRGRDRWCHVH